MRAAALCLVIATSAIACASSKPAPLPVRPGPPPAKLAIQATIGADVYVDGIFVGVAPLPKPVEMDPGPHVVDVSMNGHVNASQEVQTARSETTKLAIDLDETGQRKGAYSALAFGGIGVATGVVFGVLALVEHRKAQDLDGFSEDVSGEDQQTYDEAIAARDRYGHLSGVAAGLGLASFAFGAVLFAFDAPPKPHAIQKRTEVRVTPLASPGFAGVSSEVRF